MSEKSVKSVKSAAVTGEERGEGKFPKGLVLRLFAYLIAGHLFAGFLYLLFMLGGQNQ
ncbi:MULTISPECIES: DUF6126 family protein [Streptomyces]|uniref:Small hydrophobic protein n=1 Tax=Streptomyces hydrogenans TaxID=1873719 RepID=A0ABQ3PNM3_9ACTN|nr:MULTISPECIES: DUF6126 family protein [Streptomyces]MCM1950004.1 DUF6126 family protein [Streptomyces sp. G2]GHG40809.1 hypothetical protein GCM10018784_63190 [Streptomyces hydrogenans]GHI26630.1 hypothetical protein Shyd_80010 [Streptomyces hydrogenans]GHJ94704.1 hypothetical protein SNE510_42230 [Streptomyces sp. NE5-10]